MDNLDIADEDDDIGDDGTEKEDHPPAGALKDGAGAWRDEGADADGDEGADGRASPTFPFQPMSPPRWPVTKGRRRSRASSQEEITEQRLARRVNL